MSAFCIYGMTMHLARELAEDRVGRYVDLGAGRRREMTQEERVAAVGHRARDIYEKWRPRQISPAFDTPQFALDWLAVAHRSTKMRGGAA